MRACTHALSAVLVTLSFGAATSGASAITTADRAAAPTASISGALRTRSIEIDAAALETRRVGDVVELALFEDVTVAARVSGMTRVTPDSVTLLADTLPPAEGRAALTIRGGQISGGIWTRNGAFGLLPATTGAERSMARHASRSSSATLAIHWDPEALVTCDLAPSDTRAHRPRFADVHGAPGAAGAPAARRQRNDARERSDACNCGDDGGTVDVLCVYTGLARAAAGGAATIELRIAEAVADANLALDDSALPAVQFNIVGFEEVDYDEVSPDWLDHLTRLGEPADGYIDEVHGARDAAAADLVSLFVDDTRFGGGAAWNYIWSDTSGFSVVNWRATGGGNLTLAHEFGHNFGCVHDHANAATPAFPFMYGYRFDDAGDEIGTIMAVNGIDIYAPVFSNPDLTYNGSPLGRPISHPEAAYNALGIELTRWALANFRDAARITDCNGNGIDDATDISSGTSLDANGNCRPDECERRLYVDASAAEDGDGLSWPTARRSLAAALDLAQIPCSDISEVWVADGVYTPDDGSGDRWARFVLTSGVGVYGGFQGQSHPGGGETSLAERDPAAHVTVLSGDIGTVGVATDNVHSVVEAIATDDTAILDGFTIQDAHSDYSGGGIWCSAASPILRDCIVTGNFAAQYGGGMLLNAGSAPTLERCTIRDNEATWSGGGVGILDSQPTLTDCTIESNVADYGGGAWAYGATTAQLVRVTLLDNTARFGSGGLDAYAGATLSVADSRFEINTASDGGAGGAGVGAGCTADFVDCTFVGNTCSGAGGAIAAYDALLFVDRGAFSANTAAIGGAISASSAVTAAISQSTLDHNNAAQGAGALDIWDAVVVVSDSDFGANETSDGDGGAVRADASQADFRGCRFDTNQAAFGGGALAVWGSDLSLTDCVLAENAAAWGGAMACNSALLALERLDFTRNQATTYNGGALDLWSCTVDAVNVVLAGNISSGLGGAIWMLTASSVNLTNCTLAGNQGQTGGGVASQDSSLTITSTILWGNVDSAGGSTQTQQLTMLTGAPAVAYSCVEGWDGSLGGAGNIASNPLFADAVNANLRLAAGSPCIDAGDSLAMPAGVVTDRDGNARLVDDPAAADTGRGPPPIVDMGAYERQYPCQPCDVDCDGSVNGFDIQPLVELLSGQSSPCSPCAGDANADGSVNGFDIQTFVECLTGG